ncbi:MAG: hypothetical protein VX346_28985 [Planctomycetota bacterium]|nr:hypothetical protein [Planctomycetota bacterium]
MRVYIASKESYATMPYHVLPVLTPLLGEQSGQHPLSVLVSFLPFVVLVLLIVLAVYGAKRSVRRRTAGFQQVAGMLGLRYVEYSAGHLMDQLAEFQLFAQGKSRRISNVMQGKIQDTEVSVFDYAYTTGAGKRAQTHRQTVICFQGGTASWPNFALRPAGPFYRFTEGPGDRPIEGAVPARLSETLVLRGTDEVAVRALFGEDQWRVIETLSPISCECRGDRFLFYRQRQRVRPDQLEQLLAEGLDLCKLFPSSDV